MAVALFPMLREMDIHSNPLTTLRSGDPPLLTYYLHERLGITIKRKVAREALKPPLKLWDDPSWTVEERIPEFSKKPLLMEVPGSTRREKKKASEPEGGKSRDDTQHFFATQATDVPEYERDVPAVDKQTAGNEERWMDSEEKPSPDVVQPIGIQTAVRMLQHTLKRLNVHRDPEQTRDTVQIPCRRRERRVKERPVAKPTEPPTSRLDQMLGEIKESATIRKVPLSAAVRGAGVSGREQREALSLLGDMKRKHEMVHKKTMEQAARVQSDQN